MASSSSMPLGRRRATLKIARYPVWHQPAHAGCGRLSLYQNTEETRILGLGPSILEWQGGHCQFGPIEYTLLFHHHLGKLEIGYKENPSPDSEFFMVGLSS
jgi:hypothetical protein